MTSPLTSVTLPPEIIQTIVNSLVTARGCGGGPIALPASDPITKTLLTLTRTSKITYAAAVKNIFSHCLYIDSFRRLKDLTRTLLAKQTKYSLRTSTQLIQQQDTIRTDILKATTSLYLAPYEVKYNSDDQRPSGYHWPAMGSAVADVQAINLLLSILAPNLKRLVTFFEVGEDNFNPTLSKLTTLEVFSSTTGGMGWNSFLLLGNQGKDKPSWAHWPNLRVLAMGGKYLASDFWKWCDGLKSLERVIVTNGAGAGRSSLQEWSHMQGAKQKSLEVRLVDVRWNEHVWGSDCWSVEDLWQLKQILVPPQSQDGNEVDSERCQHWVKKSLLEGNETIDDALVQDT